MPQPQAGAQGASRYRATRVAPLFLIAFAAAAIIPFVSPTAPVEAACGAWNSKKAAPPTIRVFRAKTGDVDVVDFREYVGIVMASGEWPTYLPKAVLEVGATAVKQYGWYYTLDGNHRSSYKTDAGVCYDVRDDTNDQLFRPEKADVTPKQKDAVAATWPLTLRKNDRFFLTGYRAGNDVRCARDADGWKIYAASAVDCARKGWGRQRIQEAYLSPNIDFVWTDDLPVGKGDHTAPTVSVPRTAIRAGSALASLRVDVTWTGKDSQSGLAAYRLQHRVDGGAWKTVPLSEATSTSVALGLRADHRHQFRLHATDAAGNRSSDVEGPTIIPKVVESGRAKLVGPWTLLIDRTASGDVTRYSKHAGDKARLAFTGRGIAVVSPRGPGEGKARIFLDGVQVSIVDLEADVKQPRRVVFAQTWHVSDRHTITVQVVGTTGRPRVDVDAFVVLR